MRFSNDSKFLVSGSLDNTVRIWSMDTLAEIRVFSGHDAPIHHVAFSPNDRYICSVSEDATARVWDLAEAANVQVLRTQDGWSNDLCFSPNGRYILILLKDRVQFWDLQEQASSVRSDSFHDLSGIASPPPAAPKLAQVLAAPGTRAAASFLSVNSGLQHDSIRTLIRSHPTREIRENMSKCQSACYSPDGLQVAIGYSDGKIRLWSVAGTTLNCIRLLQASADDIRTIAFSASGHYLVTGGRDSTRIWDLTVDGAVCVLKGGRGSLSRDGHNIALRHDSGTSVTVVNCHSIQHQMTLLNALLRHGTAAEIQYFLKQADLHHRCRFRREGVVFNSLLAAARFYQNDIHRFEAFLRAFPDLTVQNIGFRIDSPLHNAFHWAIQTGLKSHVQLLIEYAAGRIQTIQDQNAEPFYYECLTFTRSLAALASKFPDLACLLADRFIVDISDPEDNRGSVHKMQYDSPELISRTHPTQNLSPAEQGVEPVSHKVILLPEIVNLQYWQSTGQQDPLTTFVNYDLLDAFRTPALRTIVRYRWAFVKNFFILQFLLYILFVASATTFTINLAGDDLSLSLEEFYDSPTGKISLAFGFIALVLNLWFLVTEIVEFNVMSFSYLIHPWKLLFIGSHFLAFVVVYLHATRQLAQFSVASVLSLLVWLKLLLYLRAFSGSGIFIRMVLMIAFEIRFFLLIWSIVLMGFANAYYVVFRGMTPEQNNLALSFITMYSGSVHGMNPVLRNSSSTVDGVFPFDDASQLYNLQLLLYAGFTLLANVLMLNLLIAQMGSVFSRVTQLAGPQYFYQKATVLLHLERLFIRRRVSLRRNPWLHIVAPETSDIWASGLRMTKMTMLDLSDQLHSHSDSTQKRMDDIQHQLHEKIDHLRELVLAPKGTEEEVDVFQSVPNTPLPKDGPSPFTFKAAPSPKPPSPPRARRTHQPQAQPLHHSPPHQAIHTPHAVHLPAAQAQSHGLLSHFHPEDHSSNPLGMFRQASAPNGAHPRPTQVTSAIPGAGLPANVHTASGVPPLSILIPETAVPVESAPTPATIVTTISLPQDGIRGNAAPSLQPTARRETPAEIAEYSAAQPEEPAARARRPSVLTRMHSRVSQLAPLGTDSSTTARLEESRQMLVEQISELRHDNSQLASRLLETQGTVCDMKAQMDTMMQILMQLASRQSETTNTDAS
eukprot:m.896051 g.896051  ORF g.896051 m.896051 type:complete len:1174 (+) comp60004_c0_seq12:302-3823(+)